VSAGTRQFLGLFRFEWRHHTRQLTFAAAVVGLAAFALLLVDTGFGPQGVHVNAPYMAMYSLGLFTLIATFVVTIFCAGAALRDVEHGMTELIFSTPVGPTRFLAVRFAGLFAAVTVAMLVTALALILAPYVVPLAPEEVGPFRPGSFAWAFVVLVLPNLFLLTALLFAVAILTRSTVATYVGGVGVYCLYWVTAALIDSPLMAGAAPVTPEALARAAILDPLGLSAFFEQTRYWTVAERNTQDVAFTGHLLLNRLLWLGVAGAVLAFVHRRFALRVAAGPKVRLDPMGATTPAPIHPYRPTVPASQGGGGLAFVRATRLELSRLFRSWTFLAMMVLWAFVAVMEAFGQLGGGEYGTRILPTAGLLLDAIQVPLLLLGAVAIAYYAAEVAWRERLVGIDPLVDATATSTAVFYGAKAVALATMPMVMAAVGVVIGAGVQWTSGAPSVQVGTLASLFWSGGVPLAFFAVGALALQALTPNRWLGMLAGLVLAVIARRGEALGLEDPLLRFGSFPGIAFSEMDGFGPLARPFALFGLYWGLATLLLGCVAWGVWRRGMETGLWTRIRGMGSVWGRRGRALALGSGVTFLLFGLYLRANADQGRPRESRVERERWAADYERIYRPTAGRAQPSIVEVQARVDLRPSERQAEVSGRLTLENRTVSTIDTVWVVVPRGVSEVELSLSGSDSALVDRRFAIHVFPLRVPIAPGERRLLNYRGVVDQGGIRTEGFDFDITGNGTYFTSRATFPSVGYRPTYELDDPRRRTELGLVGERTGFSGTRRPWITFEGVISTERGQIALAPGELLDQWDSAGRPFFHYKMDGPMTPDFGVASARYAVRGGEHDGVRVEVYYDPAHSANVERIYAAMTRSLDLFNPRFGRYRHGTLRLAEVPTWAGFGGYAHAGLILMTEDRGFLADRREEDVDLVTRRVAHEVAHQWWGHVVDPIEAPGATTIVETLAKYSEQLAIGDLHGDSAVTEMVAFDEDRYLAGRGMEPDSEPTLLTSRGESYIYYGKGAVAMRAIAAAMGASAVDRALGQFAEKKGGPEGRATANDLEAELLAEATTGDAKAVVREWFQERVARDPKVDSVSVVTGPGGARFAELWLSGEEGSSVEFKIYGGSDGAPRTLYAGSVRLTPTSQRFTPPVSEHPTFVLLDPEHRIIDLDRMNDRKRFAVE
jgi:ABC-2 type transport system permease protein